MKIYKNLIILVLTIIVLTGLVGCVQETAQDETSMEVAQASKEPTTSPTEDELPTEPPEPTEIPTAEPTEEDSEPTEELAAASDDFDYCVECYVDQQMLIDTAAPVEEVESENEGAG